jgi:alkyl hydroperoxide reductase subunit AhpC
MIETRSFTISVNYLPLGRDVNEVLRIVEALQFTEGSRMASAAARWTKAGKM